jgi:hypothetical protein
MSSRSRLVSSYKLYSVVGVSFALPCQYVNLGTAHNLGFPLPRELVAGGSLPEYDYSAVFSFIRSAHPSWEPKTGKGFLGDLQEVHDNLEEGLPLPGTPYTLKEYLLPGDVPTVVVSQSTTVHESYSYTVGESAGPTSEELTAFDAFLALHSLALNGQRRQLLVFLGR